jgi:hypothetical protein
MDTSLRTANAGATGSTLGTRAGAAARLVKPHAAGHATEHGSTDKAAPGSAAAHAPSRPSIISTRWRASSNP